MYIYNRKIAHAPVRSDLLTGNTPMVRFKAGFSMERSLQQGQEHRLLI